MDPITASLLFQGAGALIQGIGDSNAAKKAAKLQSELSAQGEAAIPGLEKKVGEYRVGESMRKLRQLGSQDPIGDLARQNLQRSQASSVNALKSGGAKSLFALPSTIQSFTDKERKIDADSFGRLKSTLQTVGQAEESINRAKFNQDVNDLNSARSQALGFKMDAFNQEQAGKDARLGMLTSGLSTLGSLAAAGSFGDGTGEEVSKSNFIKSGTEVDSAVMPTGVPDYVKAAQKSASAGSMTITPENQLTPSLNRREVVLRSDPFAEIAPSPLVPRQASVNSLIGFGPSNGLYGPGSFDAGARSTGSGAPFRNLTPPMVGALDLPDYRTPSALDISSSRDIQALLDIIGSGALGDEPLAKGGRTKGSFNHSSNDMKIVDKNGKSTGMSVTGDEVVLNPLQQKKVLEQSSYFRSLMKTPRFK